MYLNPRTSISRVRRAILWVALLLFVNPSLAETPAQIAIVSSAGSLPFQQAMSGLTSRLQEASPSAEIVVYLVDGTATETRRTIAELHSLNPDVICALGSAALGALNSSSEQVPIVASLITNSAEIDQSKDTTGIVLETSVDEDFDIMLTLLPETNRIGVLYSPQINQAKVDRAIRIARDRGLTLNAIAINSPKELPVALGRLARTVDVLWGIPDVQVLSGKTSREFLLESFRRKIPLVGPSPPWTKAGALYSLEWDYTDIGKQSADLAIQLIEGALVQALPIQTPRTIGYSLNLNTAEKINIQFEKALIDKASKVYE